MIPHFRLSGSDSSPPAVPQRQAFFLSEFWNLVSSFLSCPPGLGRLVWAAASLLVRPFRAPPAGRAGGGGTQAEGKCEGQRTKDQSIGVGRADQPEGAGHCVSLGHLCLLTVSSCTEWKCPDVSSQGCGRQNLVDEARMGLLWGRE